MARAGGKEAMDRLRGQLDTFEAEERARLAAESALAAQLLERGRLQVVAGSVVIALLMIWFLLAMNRNLRRQARLADGLAEADLPIPQERWFTNLTSKGNTGAASIFIILEELFNGGRLRSGERLLCYVPESGRFSSAFMHLTVVGDEA